jgi:small conductance mechanosensitive channel
MNVDKLYNKAYDWILNNGPGLIAGVVVLFVGLWLINLFVKWSHSGMHKKNVDPSLKPFLLSLIAVALRILLVLGVMQIVGIQMTLFAAIIGAFGVAAGLALSGTLQNFASGVLILLLRPYVVGDNIIAQGLEGTVTSIQIFYTIVTTFDNRTVIIPNSKLSNEVIINLSREGVRRLDIELKMPNAIDIKQIKFVIDESISKAENILDKPERRIGIGTIEPDAYRVNVNLWVHAHGFQDAKLAIQEKLLQDIKDSGLKIPGL